MKKTWTLTLCLACMILSLMLVASCGKKEVKTTPEPSKVEAPPAAKDTTTAKEAPAPAPAKVATEEAPAKEATMEKGPVKESGDTNAEMADNVFFDFDSSVIPDSQVAEMEKEAAFLKNNPNAKITIEGHCDERGTEEYNIALGDRRAASAKSYLEKAGVVGDRMKTVSYGKEKPIAVGHNEEAWAKNRRAHFVNK